MQPIQFQCGHCGKIMAVGSEHLGQQVRCPHCQQIVIAPPLASAPPPVPNPAEAAHPGLGETVLHVPAPAGDAEDIFSQTEVSDDLFGRAEAPRVEMPPESLAPTLPGDNAFPPPQPEATFNATMAWAPPPESSAPYGANEGTEVLPSGGMAPWMTGATETLAPPPGEATPPVEESPAFTDERPASLTRARRQKEAKVPWFTLVVFMPLLLYAIVMTVATAWLYHQVQDVSDRLRRRFEIMPDEGDKPGVEKKGKQLSLWKYGPKLPTQPLPEHLRTTLNEPLRIGDLEVTPVRVEHTRVMVVEGKFNPEFCTGDSLVLYLRMKNLSSEYAFAPLDNYFDRRYDGGARPPFTLLEVGDRYKCYGGPAEWYPLGDVTHRRVWVKGRNNVPDVLEPGEEKESFVCTNGYDEKTVDVLFGADQPSSRSYLWRVRVRRGLVNHGGKEYSTTAVIGVRFSDKDILDALPEAQ